MNPRHVKVVPETGVCQTGTTFDEAFLKPDGSFKFTYKKPDVKYELEDHRTTNDCPTNCMKQIAKDIFTTAKGEELAVRECAL